MYKIGPVIVKIADETKIPAELKYFLRDPVSGEADITWDIDTVDKRQWPLMVKKNDGTTWELGRHSHYISFNCDTRVFTLRIITPYRTEAFYWLRRDIFGTIGSVSGLPLLHSSSVIHNDEGYIFCADSGTGKSTIMNNLKAFSTPVNDETNWIIPDGDTWALVNQNYYFGDSDNLTVPVKGIYLLKQSPDCKITDDCESIEIFHLYLAVHLPFDTDEPFLKARSHAVAELMKEIRPKHLHVNLKPEEISSTLFSN